jgi:hypothetical protein
MFLHMTMFFCVLNDSFLSNLSIFASWRIVSLLRDGAGIVPVRGGGGSKAVYISIDFTFEINKSSGYAIKFISKLGLTFNFSCNRFLTASR